MTYGGKDEKHGWWIRGKEDRSNRIVVFRNVIDTRVQHIQNEYLFMHIEDCRLSVWIMQVSIPPMRVITDEKLFCQILLEKK